MFGIMKPKGGCSTEGRADRLYHRQHYCGTCKAIGQAYGQKSRLLLNFDGVFLAELLTQLHQTAVQDWETRLQRPNTCFTMPEEEAPWALRYAGAATLLFSALSTADQAADTGQWRWRLTHRFYSSAFQQALSDLEGWGLDGAHLQQLAQQQHQLEAQAQRQPNLAEHLAHYSQPTQAITAEVFAHGSTDPSIQPALSALGSAFGQLLYVLDAFEDYEKDVFEGAFNPLALYWQSPRTLSESQLEQVRALLLEQQHQVADALAALPLEAAFVERQQERLVSNLALRLYRERTVPSTWQERLQQRYQNAQETAQQWLCAADAPWRRLQYYLVVLAVFMSPQTKAYLPQDGKLETLGWMTFATALLASLGWVQAKRHAPPVDKKNKRQRRQWKRWWKRLRRRWSRRSTEETQDCGTCFGDCCTTCCEESCQNCGQDCGQDCCDCCCDAINESENPTLTWLLLIFVPLLIAGIIVLIVLLT